MPRRWRGAGRPPRGGAWCGNARRRQDRPCASGGPRWRRRLIPARRRTRAGGGFRRAQCPFAPADVPRGLRPPDAREATGSRRRGRESSPRPGVRRRAAACPASSAPEDRTAQGIRSPAAGKAAAGQPAPSPFPRPDLPRAHERKSSPAEPAPPRPMRPPSRHRPRTPSGRPTQKSRPASRARMGRDV